VYEEFEGTKGIIRQHNVMGSNENIKTIPIGQHCAKITMCMDICIII
jgi:hypothetical protein